MSTAQKDPTKAGVGAGAALPATWLREPNAETGSKRGCFRWLLTSEAAVNLLLVAVMTSVVWGGIGLHLTQQHREIDRRAQRESSNLAQAAAEGIRQTIASVDDTLQFMRAIYMADPKHFDISAWTNCINKTREIALEFALIGRDGKLVADSLGPVAAESDFSDREFFRKHARRCAGSVFHQSADRGPRLRPLVTAVHTPDYRGGRLVHRRHRWPRSIRRG